MKYKLLKETPWVADGSIIEVDDFDKDVFITNDRFEEYREGKDYSSETYDWMNWHIQNHPEDFEEVKETPKPRWKVGDNVVKINGDRTRFVKVSDVEEIYKGEFWYDGYGEYCFRDPTPEELSTYFR